MSYNTYPQNPFPPNSENAGGGGSPYVLPIASANTLGGVKVGSNLTIDANGVLSAPAPVLNFSTTEQATGQKWIDGKDIYFITAQNVAYGTTLATEVDKIIDARIARHGKPSNETYKIFGDGFVQNDGGAIILDNHTATYGVWSSDGSLLDPTADHVTIYYTKTESEV